MEKEKGKMLLSAIQLKSTLVRPHSVFDFLGNTRKALTFKLFYKSNMRPRTLTVTAVVIGNLTLNLVHSTKTLGTVKY